MYFGRHARRVYGTGLRIKYIAFGTDSDSCDGIAQIGGSMSTAPVVPVISTSWLKAHETLLIVFMLLASFGWLGNKYLDRKATETAATAAVATQQAAEARSQAALAAQDYKVALDAMTTAI